MIRFRLRAAGGLLALLCTALVSTTSSAVADNWFGASGQYGLCSMSGNRTDSAAMSFNYSDLTAHMTTATDWVRSVKIEPSDMSTSTHATASAETDVIVLDQNYTDYCSIPWSSGVYGYENCRSIRPDNSCEQANVRFNNSFSAGLSVAAQRSLACHEVGHAIGLAHRDQPGCMHTTSFASASYNTHDLTHINNTF